MTQLSGSQVGQLGVSTAQGAMAGAPLGPLGMIAGGGIGFVSGLIGINSQNAQQDAMELQAERARLSAIELNKAREIERRMIGINAAKQRRQIAQRADTMAATAQTAVAARGVRGGTASVGAESSVTASLLSNFQTNLLAQATGEEISDIRQRAANIQAGIEGPQAGPQQDLLGDVFSGTGIGKGIEALKNPSVSNVLEATFAATPIGGLVNLGKNLFG